MVTEKSPMLRPKPEKKCNVGETPKLTETEVVEA